MKELDLSYIESICEGDKEMMKEFSDIFIAQVPEFIADFDTAYAEKDAVKLGRVAHKAKSSVRVMGLEDLGNELGKLEEAAESGDFLESYIDYINTFKQESKDTLNQLNKLFA